MQNGELAAVQEFLQENPDMKRLFGTDELAMIRSGEVADIRFENHGTIFAHYQVSQEVFENRVRELLQVHRDGASIYAGTSRNIFRWSLHVTE